MGMGGVRNIYHLVVRLVPAWDLSTDLPAAKYVTRRDAPTFAPLKFAGC
jgi:hypothetical protein